MARWQYQQRAEPLVETLVETVTSDKWAPIYPSRVVVRVLCLTAAIVAGSCFLDATPIITIDKWQGSYPNRLDKLKQVQPLGWFDTKLYWFSGPEVITLDKWIPNYPDRLDRAKRVLWLDWSMVDSYLSHVPISATMLYLRRYLDDPLG